MNIELVKGNPYFSDTKSKIKQYPYLNKNISCDVLIVGAGIDGSIAAYYLSKSGIKVVVVDKNCAGICSTSSATSLLEYQLDEHADAIKKYLSKEEAVAAYRLGLGAINDIASFVKTYGNRCHFSKRPTLVYTQKKSDENELMREYKFRKDNGFRTKIINNNNNPFPFDIECDIYCEDGGAEFNSYLFCKQMLQQAQKHGAKIYEHTEVVKIEYEPQITTVFTNYNISIKCKKVICATGYNTSLFAEKELCDLFTSFTIVTSPLKNFTWHKKNTTTRQWRPLSLH